MMAASSSAAAYLVVAVLFPATLVVGFRLATGRWRARLPRV
jgi:hypothetical protein